MGKPVQGYRKGIKCLKEQFALLQITQRLLRPTKWQGSEPAQFRVTHREKEAGWFYSGARLHLEGPSMPAMMEEPGLGAVTHRIRHAAESTSLGRRWCRDRSESPLAGAVQVGPGGGAQQAGVAGEVGHAARHRGRGGLAALDAACATAKRASGVPRERSVTGTAAMQPCSRARVAWGRRARRGAGQFTDWHSLFPQRAGGSPLMMLVVRPKPRVRPAAWSAAVRVYLRQRAGRAAAGIGQ